MLRNVTLRDSERDGKSTWRLLGPDGAKMLPFDTFADSLLRKHPLNTRLAYCRHLAEFIDYVYEAAFALTTVKGHLRLTRQLLEEVIESYDDYLVLGCDSGNRIARLVNESMPSPRNKPETSSAKHAPVRRFLELSEQVRQQTVELVQAGVQADTVDGSPLLRNVCTRRKLSVVQRRAMLGSSMIAGVVAGGPQFAKSIALPTISPQVKYDPTRAFPYDSIAAFIAAQPSYRDRASYSLLAASGCRAHEGLQLLFDDIDFTTCSVWLRDPKARPNHPSYLWLTPQMRERLAWKGRATESTLLIEPFASMFFESLEQYLKNEYIPHGLHRFIFQYGSRVKEAGLPFFLSRATSRLEAFKRAVAASGLEVGVSGPHSLRHAYGTYLLNYFPRINGDYGLPPTLVQQLMGHADVKVTMKYARYDDELKAIELRHANAMIYDGGAPKNILQLKLEALNSQVLKLEAELAREKQLG